MKFAFMCHKNCFVSLTDLLGQRILPPPCSIFPLPIFLFLFLRLLLQLWLSTVRDCWHPRQKKTPAVKNRTDLWWTYALCFPLSDSVGPSGKRLQLRWLGRGGGGGRRSKREGESWVARRRSQISQWLHGVMHIWSAAMDCNPRPLFLILHVLLSCAAPAFPIIYPPNEGKRTLNVRTCVGARVCARARLCVWCASVRSRQCPNF